MTGNALESRPDAFQPGLEAYKAYLDSLKDCEYTFSAPRLLSIIDSFSAPLCQHMSEEIPTLLDLSRYGDLVSLSRIYSLHPTPTPTLPFTRSQYQPLKPPAPDRRNGQNRRPQIKRRDAENRCPDILPPESRPHVRERPVGAMAAYTPTNPMGDDKGFRELEQGMVALCKL